MNSTSSYSSRGSSNLNPRATTFIRNSAPFPPRRNVFNGDLGQPLPTLPGTGSSISADPFERPVAYRVSHIELDGARNNPTTPRAARTPRKLRRLRRLLRLQNGQIPKPIRPHERLLDRKVHHGRRKKSISAEAPVVLGQATARHATKVDEIERQARLIAHQNAEKAAKGFSDDEDFFPGPFNTKEKGKMVSFSLAAAYPSH
ncbi:hypothetical protein BJ170DRAFT_684848 [Xylariales sp. AK1849]|nr:hypothetical protein BJ170DRAFT_684848 [Xylariales sp. AK1849]